MYYRDQMEREVWIEKIPKRIISLVPSQTELLLDLGLEDRLVGVTKFCIHPSRIKQEKKIIGGTKQFRFDVIKELRPDLIIGNKEENYKEGIERLAKDYPVWMSDVFKLEDALEMIREVGLITGKEQEAYIIAKNLTEKFKQTFPQRGTAVYLIWQDPIMVAGKNTFINDMMGKAGFKNPIEEERYPSISLKELISLDPDYVLLSSEPFPFKEKHMGFYRTAIPRARVKLVDGEMFSWYGTRLLQAPEYFKSI
ncbi:ABC transporter substrate-binding protein [Echinicola sp. CAU 1574]|uniref:ABC transporter substrate-binding protein n=1 Tax=Echinicola arenosa TaxID=2774144 RepID=A0ABR9AP69_9BACT|nr:helical backbone metal receptor [Echinicola arenosa]MBD8490374.1 ABC transporter substrate-binding protein [Echinicola arenosa]